MPSRPYKALEFFATHRAFTRAQFSLAFGPRPNQGTINSLLTYHVNAGRIKRIGRGVYATISAGDTSKSSPPDFFAIAAKLRPDGIFAYRSALQLHGLAHPTPSDVVLLSSQCRLQRLTPLGTYQFVPPPLPLRVSGIIDTHTTRVVRYGIQIQVTSFERTIVDALYRPKLSGGVEQVIRSLDLVQEVNATAVVEYAMLLQMRSLAAVVGWWLNIRRSDLRISNDVLRPLRYFLPYLPIYRLGAKPGDSVLINPWQLMLPQRLVQRTECGHETP